MKVLFFGTGAFGLPALDALKKSSHTLSSIVTTLDKPKGRHLKPKASPVKDWAGQNNLPYLEVSKKNMAQLPPLIQSLEADLFVVIAFGILLSKELLGIPKLMALNVHSSLLPRYRGAAPIHWALINGDAETGVTVMRMTEKLDAGDILLQKKMALMPEDDMGSLEKRLSLLGADALLEAIESLGNPATRFTAQDETLSTVARKITKEDGRIIWSRQAVEIMRYIRALKVWPKSYFFYEGQRMLVLGAEITDEENNRRFAPGTLVCASAEQGIRIAASDRIIRINRLQLEGRRPLLAAEFLRGFPLKAQAVLE